MRETVGEAIDVKLSMTAGVRNERRCCPLHGWADLLVGSRIHYCCTPLVALCRYVVAPCLHCEFKLRRALRCRAVAHRAEVQHLRGGGAEALDRGADRRGPAQVRLHEVHHHRRQRIRAAPVPGPVRSCAAGPLGGAAAIRCAYAGACRYGADVQQANNHGWTALMGPSEMCSSEVDWSPLALIWLTSWSGWRSL